MKELTIDEIVNKAFPDGIETCAHKKAYAKSRKEELKKRIEAFVEREKSKIFNPPLEPHYKPDLEYKTHNLS